MPSWPKSSSAPSSICQRATAGCCSVYSLRDTNRWRRANGREAVRIGVKYYGDDD